MKIKAACDMTGLTARTIRVYIEEQLISPQFTENYLGRRSFEFSKGDIFALQNIATLRKYGFSIDEIRSILLDSQQSITIIENIKSRTKTQLDEYGERLVALSRIDDKRVYSVDELAAILSQSEAELELPKETPKIKIKIKGFIVGAFRFFVVWLPFVLAFAGFVIDITSYSYPKINGASIVETLLTLAPSTSLLILTNIKFKAKRIVNWVLICLCIIAIPFSFIKPLGIVEYSETTDFRNYRDFDPDCLANRSVLFGRVFPTWPHYFESVKNEDGEWEDVYLDAKYYYRYFRFLDYTYDIYAEWPLDDEEFEKEVQRVKKVFEDAYGYEYPEIKKGDYNCLIASSYGAPLFEEVTDNYEYLIFAYNEKTNVVRYICCVSLENGVDQPYYLQLDW